MVKISETIALALDITPKGIAFAVLEGMERLYDAGVTYVDLPSKHAYVEKVETLVLRYLPQVLVLEDTEGIGFKKGPRSKHVIKRIELLALSKTLPVVKVSRKEVLSVFGTKNKYETATTVARFFPELEKRLPDNRKPWESELDRTNIFDAVSFALTAYRKPLDLEDIAA
ncbi:MAG TPA: hypothetical protein VF173_12470 [Thermoanaerobaculia bacterium]|nr:hypothetical protein [Thermoanaerobaculia bacterium]